jgi:hypothetical protein
MTHPHMQMHLEEAANYLTSARYKAAKQTEECEYDYILECLGHCSGSLRAALLHAVSSARAAGWTWVELADAAHVSEATMRSWAKR